MPTRVYLNEIFEIVAKRYEISVEELLGRSQKRYIAQPRHVAVLLCRTITNATLEQIAIRFSRHHATIFHSQRQAELQLASDPEFAAAIASLIAELRALRAA